MAQKPSFGALTKRKASATPEAVPAPEVAQSKAKLQSVPRIQTSVRLDPAMWAALNDLATRKRVETGQRVTVHDLLIEGSRHILDINGIKLSK
jgi:predicted DNA-binding ribbon-helix-helix protein